MDTTVFTDPSIIGPGLWFNIHITAKHAVTDTLKEAFGVNINALCDNFKCMKCKPHFRKFIDTHPFKDYWNIRNAHGNDIGLFKWTWELHNQVNKFLNKYQPTLEEAYEYYSHADVGVCFDCGSQSQAKFPLPTKPASQAELPTLLNIFNEVSAIEKQPFRLISKPI